MSGVDRQDRHADRRGLARSGQHSAITPQHDRQSHGAIELLRHTGAVTKQAKVLIRVGETNHAAGTAGTHDAMARGFQTLLNRVCRLDRQILAVVHDQSNGRH